MASAESDMGGKLPPRSTVGRIIDWVVVLLAIIVIPYSCAMMVITGR